MDTVPLKAAARTQDITTKALRTSGKVPVVLYGNETENTPLECDYNEILKAYVKAGKSTIVDLDANGKKVPVLFHKLDYHPVSDQIIHVDFYAVDMKKEIEADVPLRLVGQAPAVKDEGGVLVTSLDHVTVKCLPTDLPHEIEVSIEKLATFEDALHVADIAAPKGVTIEQSPETVIATVQEPRKEEEVAPVATEGGEGAEGEKKEGAEGAAEGEGGEGEKKEGEGKKKE